VEIQPEVLRALDDALGLGGRSRTFTADTRLFGSLPELDSMAVVDLISALEERFGIAFEDDEITGEVFASVGSLAEFVRLKLPA
jgi:acyl carrier protein